jgi:DNA-directed RNA polymerase specialized sigma24 family protein
VRSRGVRGDGGQSPQRLSPGRITPLSHRALASPLRAERDAPGDAASPAAPLDRNDELRAALAALPPRQRAVLVLRYFLDLPEAEAAAAPQCSLGTVKSTGAQLTTPSGTQTQTFR